MSQSHRPAPGGPAWIGALRRALRRRRTHHAALGSADVPRVVPANVPRQQLAEKRHARTRWLRPPDGGFPSLGHGLLMPSQVRQVAGPATWPGRAVTRRALPAGGHRRRAYSDFVKLPRRLSIPGCIGCGAMRQYESCAGACRERRLELVSGGDYEELTAATAARRVRIEGLWAVVGELACTEPGPGEWRIAYEAVQQSARSALRRFRPAAESRDDELLSPAQTVIVWRCEDCGGVDAPQECIDVCIWGPADWVDAASYEPERSRAAVDREVEQSLTGLLRRFAFATPRDGQWERGWRAFQSQARLALRSRESRRVADEMVIGQAQADG